MPIPATPIPLQFTLSIDQIDTHIQPNSKEKHNMNEHEQT